MPFLDSALTTELVVVLKLSIGMIVVTLVSFWVTVWILFSVEFEAKPDPTSVTVASPSIDSVVVRMVCRMDKILLPEDSAVSPSASWLTAGEMFPEEVIKLGLVVELLVNVLFKGTGVVTGK